MRRSFKEGGNSMRSREVWITSSVLPRAADKAKRPCVFILRSVQDRQRECVGQLCIGKSSTDRQSLRGKNTPGSCQGKKYLAHPMEEGVILSGVIARADPLTRKTTAVPADRLSLRRLALPIKCRPYYQASSSQCPEKGSV